MLKVYALFYFDFTKHKNIQDNCSDLCSFYLAFSLFLFKKNQKPNPHANRLNVLLQQTICCMDSKAATELTLNCCHNFLKIIHRDTISFVTKNWMKSCLKNHFPRVLRCPLPNGKNMYFQDQELASSHQTRLQKSDSKIQKD